MSIRSTKKLSVYRPFPSMLMVIPFAKRTPGEVTAGKLALQDKSVERQATGDWQRPNSKQEVGQLNGEKTRLYAVSCAGEKW
jgi:hypothetical protein